MYLHVYPRVLTLNLLLSGDTVLRYQIPQMKSPKLNNPTKYKKETRSEISLGAKRQLLYPSTGREAILLLI